MIHMDWKDEADSGLFWLRRVPVMQEGRKNQDFGRRCAGNGRFRERGEKRVYAGTGYRISWLYSLLWA